MLISPGGDQRVFLTAHVSSVSKVDGVVIFVDDDFKLTRVEKSGLEEGRTCNHGHCYESRDVNE